ncbi:MAG: SLC13/DASS family transporter [Crocinitomicaceae bacterium]|nr:SLC13/DASS family transporter [Crocinitomicaceae bacterium]
MSELDNAPPKVERIHMNVSKFPMDSNAVIHLFWLLRVCSGPVLAVLIYFMVPETLEKSDGTLIELGYGGKTTAALVGWMVVWWLTEAIPLYITALLPLIVLPLSGQQSIAATSAPYGHRVIFLALGGFVLAAAIEKWHLHKKFAYFVIGLCGSEPRHIIAGFMIASAMLSMWISNVATAIIMLPVAMSIINLQDKDNADHKRFAVCLLLSICYSCSVGGMGTLIGTGPNMFFAAYMEGELQREFGFARWMGIAVPVILIFLPLMWLLLTRVLFPISSSAKQLVFEDVKNSEPWDQGAKFTFAIFIVCALSWTFLPLIRQLPAAEHLTDTGIALIAVLFLFILPSDKGPLLDWDYAVRKIPWGILILLGGGLCLAQAVSRFGVGELLAYQLSGLEQYPDAVIILAVVTLMVFFTEISSNIASVTALTPIFASIAVSMGLDPVKLIIPITMAASCAFMLPVATPTNTVIFGSGLVRIKDMARAGFVLNLVAILVIFIWTYFFIG